MILISAAAIIGIAIAALTVFSPKLATHNDFEDVESIRITGMGDYMMLHGGEAENLFEILLGSQTWDNICPERSSEYVGDASDYQIDINYTDGTSDVIYIDEARDAAIRQLKHGKQPPIVKSRSGEIIEYILFLLN